MDNHITISLKDNQSYDKAYSLVYDDEATDEKEIPESYWEDIKQVSDLNQIKGSNIITIPSQSRNKTKRYFHESMTSFSPTIGWACCPAEARVKKVKITTE